MCAKHYENPPMLSRVRAKIVGDVFFETQCSNIIATISCRRSPKNMPVPTDHTIGRRSIYAAIATSIRAVIN